MAFTGHATLFHIVKGAVLLLFFSLSFFGGGEGQGRVTSQRYAGVDRWWLAPYMTNLRASSLPHSMIGRYFQYTMASRSVARPSVPSGDKGPLIPSEKMIYCMFEFLFCFYHTVLTYCCKLPIAL